MEERESGVGEGGGAGEAGGAHGGGMCAASAHCFMYLIVIPRRHNGSALTQAASKDYGCVCPSDEGSEKNGITEIWANERCVQCSPTSEPRQPRPRHRRCGRCQGTGGRCGEPCMLANAFMFESYHLQQDVSE